MEFNEKLQELRKNKGLTQEELAESLYVSRTAVSKWESGRGYPSIDSLKEISKFFSVTIDDLLSSEKIIYIAERENKSNIQNICDLLFGTVDLMTILLIILPLYPKQSVDYVYSVNLFSYAESSSVHLFVYWILFLALILIGAAKITLTQIKITKGQQLITNCSAAVNIAMVLFLAITRQSYAVVIAFLLLIIKGMIIIKNQIYLSSLR